MRHALPLLASLLVASTLLGGGSVRAERDAPAAPHLAAGPVTFAFAGGDPERERVLAAIERTVSGMSFVVRPFARRRLTAGNRVFESITVAREGADLVVSRDGNVVRSPANGSEVEWTGGDGATYRVSQRLTQDGLTQRFVGKSGERRNTFTLLGDGALRLEVIVRSPRLPAPLEYFLTYRLAVRDGAGAAGGR